MKWGPDWNWIGYMNSFDDERQNGGGGYGCLLTLLIMGFTGFLIAIFGR